LGLTRLLVTTSATLGGAATLLIRLCTLWFGLGLGVVALLIFRATQHTGIPMKQEDSEEENTAPGLEHETTNSTLPTLFVSERQRGLESAPVTARNGDKAI
jgi:hypothetical protein